MRVRRLIFAFLAACTVSGCTDSTLPAARETRAANDAIPQLDGGYLGNGGRSGSDSTSTSTSAPASGTAVGGK